MYMKSFKDFRRRSVEAVLVTVGASERTVDDDFESIHSKFEHLCTTMTNCYTVSHETANHQKANLEHANDLSKLMFKIYSEQFDSEATSKWPESNCALKNSALSRKYSDCCTSANTVIGASCAATLREVGLEPFRAAASSMGPAVEETCKLRAKMVTDFDSYRRRLKSLEAKKLATESAGKEKTINDLNTEITKYAAKVKSAEQAYIEFNEKTKGDIIVNRVSHDELLDNLLVATIVCQADLHQRLATQLQQLVQLCPPDQVTRIRQQIEESVGKGGPPVKDEPSSSSGVGKSFIRAGAAPGSNRSSNSIVVPPSTQSQTSTGPPPSYSESSYSDTPYVPSVYVPPSCPTYPSSTSTPVPSEVYATYHSLNHPNPNTAPSAPAPIAQESYRQFATESKEPFKNNDVGPADATTTDTHSLPMVVALYDHEADADDELDFIAGDNVEVLEAGDGGWWKGRCKGRTGLFPVNYVQALT